MKYHFIYPDIGTGYYPSVHHGLAQLIAVLKANGHKASLHHVKKEPTVKELIIGVMRESPDIVGFTTMSNQIGYVEKWSRWIKDTSNAFPIICGGVHATLNPEEMLAMDGIDAVCVGEGEKSILDIDDGFWRKRNGAIVKGELYPLVENLDELPFPDYSLFDVERMMRARDGNFAVIVSRGCPWSCSYCCNEALREAQKDLGRYFRFRSVDSTLAMLKHYMGQYSIRSFSFADDIFGLNKEWVTEFCGKYPRIVGLPFDCNLRVESVTREMLEGLKSANCVMVDMGIESGNAWMRKEVLNRKMSNWQIIEAFETAHELGIKTRAYNMVGLPYETPEMARETLELNRLVEPDDVAVFYFCPYKGTKLYDVCKKEGFLTEKQSTGYVAESVLELPDFSHRELKKTHNEFYRYALQKKSQSYGAIMKLLIRVVSRLLRMLTWGHEVFILQVVYMGLFPLFQRLRSR